MKQDSEIARRGTPSKEFLIKNSPISENSALLW
jgi:hypothetical protein